MALQASTGVRNAMLDAIETAAGVSAVLQIFTGAQPAACATAEAGTLLAEFDLASDWAAAAAAGAKNFNNTPLSANAVGAGTAGHFRIYDSTKTTCHLQGAIGSDMTIDNSNIAVGQLVKVTSFAINASMS